MIIFAPSISTAKWSIQPFSPPARYSPTKTGCGKSAVAGLPSPLHTALFADTDKQEFDLAPIGSAVNAHLVYAKDDVKIFHEHLQKELEKTGTSVDAFYYSPFHPTKGLGDYLKDSECRKPKPGMLLQGAKDLDIELEKSYMIGDNLGDVQAGINAGCRSIMVRTGYGIDHQNRLDELTGGEAAGVCDNLLDAVKKIIDGEL